MKLYVLSIPGTGINSPSMTTILTHGLYPLKHPLVITYLQWNIQTSHGNSNADHSWLKHIYIKEITWINK